MHSPQELDPGPAPIVFQGGLLEMMNINSKGRI